MIEQKGITGAGRQEGIPGKLYPSPAAVAFVASLTEEDWKDTYRLACKIDNVADEARMNEKKRIFSMGFGEMMREFWKGRKLYVRP